MPYVYLEHTADIRMHTTGKTLEELFEDALLGVMHVLSPARGRGEKTKREIELTAPDETALLIDFLSEALLLSHTHKEIYKRADIRIKDGMLKAELHGHKVVSFNEDIKAVTYHKADVRKTNDVWETDIVFDI